MLLKASERASGQALATHLLNAHDNDHVEVHELRGFVSDNLHGAFQEIEAHSKGTRCKNYLFSLSLNPPEKESVGIEAFEDAVNRIEKNWGWIIRPEPWYSMKNKVAVMPIACGHALTCRK